MGITDGILASPPCRGTWTWQVWGLRMWQGWSPHHRRQRLPYQGHPELAGLTRRVAKGSEQDHLPFFLEAQTVLVRQWGLEIPGVGERTQNSGIRAGQTAARQVCAGVRLTKHTVPPVYCPGPALRLSLLSQVGGELLPQEVPGEIILYLTSALNAAVGQCGESWLTVPVLPRFILFF